jgi:NAD-dependent deacetylase
MTLASQEGFAANPGLVWRWYMERLSWVEEAVPNPGHVGLARLETLTPTFTLITQNVDNLHEKAGSEHVLHIHGSLARFRCNRCSAPYALKPEDHSAQDPPRCPDCGGPVRPDVVWFGEMLPFDVLRASQQAALTCDVMLVVGTSGVVYPAAELPYTAKSSGAFIIDVNPDASAISSMADVFLEGPSGEIVPQLVDAVERRLRGE